MQTDLTIEQSKRDLQLILSKFSHEIRNPVALISSELQLMASDHPEVCRYRQWDCLMDSLDYVKELLNALSDYNHAGNIHPISVNPCEFLKTVLSCEKPVLDYLGITLETHIPTLPFPVSLDRVKMRQVLFNLLRNARESIEHPHGKIIVSLAQVHGGISISVRDNGCGITKEQSEHIFSPFVTYKSNGTGLGLCICREITQAHGGSLSFQSRPGHGSVFSVFLPADICG